MSSPLVSIVTPSYNQAAFLEETIRSVLIQEYPQLEYLVVDGGSTDGSLEIIHKYAGYLTWWISEEDRGQAEAINKGLRRAHGEIVGWLNSDDMYLPGVIPAVVSAFEKHPDAGLVFGNAVSIDGQGRPLNDQVFRDLSLVDLMAFTIICQPAVFIRKRVLDQVEGLDEGYHYLLDHHLWLRIAENSSIVHLPRTLAFARHHASAKNVAQAQRFGQEAYRILSWMEAQPGLRALFVKNHRRIVAGAHRLNARYLLDAGFSGKALASYWDSLRSHPLVALQEAHRMSFALASLAGGRRLGPVYYRFKRRGIPASLLSLGIDNIQDLYEGKRLFRRAVAKEAN